MPTWKEKLHPERFEGMSGKMAAIVGYICEETGSNVTDLVESALLSEITIGPTVAKTAALGILLKITQLNRTVVQSKNADADMKALSNQLFWLASMVALSIGAINDSWAKKPTLR